MEDISPKTHHKIAIYAVCLISIAVFWPVLNGEFLNFDDTAMIIQNAIVRNFDIVGFFKPFIGLYHPLTTFSLALDYKIAGLNPSWFHFVNLLIHILNCIFVYHICRILFPNRVAVLLFVTIFFAIHPTRVESVAWITERKDVLYSLFFLSSLFYYLRYITLQSRQLFWLSLVLFLFSILAKPMSITLPILMLVCDWFLSRKLSKAIFIEKLPFFLLALLAVVANIYAQQLENKTGSSLANWLAFADGFRVLVLAISKSVLPLGLTPLYASTNQLSLSVHYIVAASFLVLVGAITYFNRSERNQLTFGVLVFVISLLPVLRIVSFQNESIYNDRYLYLPAIGIFICLATCLELIIKTKKRKYLVYTIVLIAATLFMAIVTNKLAYAWSTSDRLWAYAIKQKETNIKAFAHYGDSLVQQNRLDEAEQVLLEAVKRSNDPSYVYWFGSLIAKGRKCVVAQPLVEQAMAKHGRSIEALTILGLCSLQNRDLDNAQLIFEEAKKASSHSPKVMTDYLRATISSNLAGIYIDKGNMLAAENELKEAQRLAPYEAVIIRNLGAQCYRLGKLDEAEKYSLLAISINPNAHEAYNDLAAIYYKQRKIDLAKQWIQKGIQVQPNFASFWCNLGIIYLSSNNYKNAIDYFSKCSQLDPQNSIAKRQLEQSKVLYDKSLGLND